MDNMNSEREIEKRFL